MSVLVMGSGATVAWLAPEPTFKLIGIGAAIAGVAMALENYK